jgi:hypothetical protein
VPEETEDIINCGRSLTELPGFVVTAAIVLSKARVANPDSSKRHPSPKLVGATKDYSWMGFDLLDIVDQSDHMKTL